MSEAITCVAASRDDPLTAAGGAAVRYVTSYLGAPWRVGRPDEGGTRARVPWDVEAASVVSVRHVRGLRDAVGARPVADAPGAVVAGARCVLAPEARELPWLAGARAVRGGARPVRAVRCSSTRSVAARAAAAAAAACAAA